MNFPQYWARGNSGNFFAWRWSSSSLTEAQSLANEAAQQLMERFKSGVYPPKGGGYYPNRPFREQIMQQVKAGDGTMAAVVTRNSYGCLVLNTARVMFVDIDFPEPRAPRRGLFSLLLAKNPNQHRPRSTRKTTRWRESRCGANAIPVGAGGHIGPAPVCD